jgi:hypothetical protein
MKKLTLIMAAALLLAGITGCEILNKIKSTAKGTSTSSASSAGYVMPFAITLDGQATGKNNEITALIANPVANNAEIFVDVPTDKMIIINAFPSDAKGNVPSGAKAAILLIKKGQNKTTMDKTTDNKKLKAGTYLMNIVGDGKTARVVFTVK